MRLFRLQVRCPYTKLPRQLYPRPFANLPCPMQPAARVSHSLSPPSKGSDLVKRLSLKSRSGCLRCAWLRLGAKRDRANANAFKVDKDERNAMRAAPSAASASATVQNANGSTPTLSHSTLAVVRCRESVLTQLLLPRVLARQSIASDPRLGLLVWSGPVHPPIALCQHRRVPGSKHCSATLSAK